MGGTGRSKRRKREVEHGTGLEHLGIERLTEGTGQRDRSRRRRLAYELEKQGKKLDENPELVALVERQKKQRKIRILQARKKKGRPAAKDDDDNNDDNESDTEMNGEDQEDEESNSAAASDDEEVSDEDGEEEEGEEEEEEANGVDTEMKGRELEGGEESDDVAASDEDEEGEDDEEDEESGEEEANGVDTNMNGEELEGDDDGATSDDNDGSDEENGTEDEDEDEDDVFGSDSDLPPDELELASAKLLQEQDEEAAEAEEEVADDRARAAAELDDFKLDTGLIGRGGNEGDGDELPATRDELMGTIRGILHVLSDFKSRREDGKSRSDYLDAFRAAVCECFQYNDELCEMLMEVFPNGEVVDFMEASDGVRPLTIRTNTLRVRRRELAQALMARGMNVDPIDKWSKVGLVVYDSQVPVGATPEYLAGHYMIQSASSFLPVVALAPREGETVVDLAAAPGGKASYIGAALKHKGVLVANDAKKERIKSLVANIHRLGISNAVVTHYDGRVIPKVFGTCFDRALLDAPCSGTGIISHDAAVKNNRTKADVAATTRLQKELLLAAIDSVNHKSKTGGYVVYSTCSVLIQENEEVVDHALRKRHVKVVDSGIPFGVQGFTNMKGKQFHQGLNLAKRIYPHVHNLDGFFVCKLKKLSDRKPEEEKRKRAELDEEEGKKKKVEEEESGDEEEKEDVEERKEEGEEEGSGKKMKKKKKSETKGTGRPDKKIKNKKLMEIRKGPISKKKRQRPKSS